MYKFPAANTNLLSLRPVLQYLNCCFYDFRFFILFYVNFLVNTVLATQGKSYYHLLMRKEVVPPCLMRIFVEYLTHLCEGFIHDSMDSHASWLGFLFECCIFRDCSLAG